MEIASAGKGDEFAGVKVYFGGLRTSARKQPAYQTLVRSAASDQTTLSA
jgi:hypothetical protein